MSEIDPGWRIAPQASLALRFWDGECVLYHGASGDTHRLPEEIGRLLEQLAGGMAEIPQLVEAINLHSEDVQRALLELARLGIVEPVQ